MKIIYPNAWCQTSKPKPILESNVVLKEITYSQNISGKSRNQLSTCCSEDFAVPECR